VEARTWIVGMVLVVAAADCTEADDHGEELIPCPSCETADDEPEGACPAGQLCLHYQGGYHCAYPCWPEAAVCPSDPCDQDDICPDHLECNRQATSCETTTDLWEICGPP
jgi:hypothetical protein